MAPLDRKSIRTYRLSQRRSKVSLEGFAKPHEAGDTVARFLEKLPSYLGAKALREVASEIVRSRGDGRPVLLAMGAHVIKVGLSELVTDLLREGWVSAVATNGAGMVHDFEIAWVGHTSEDVDESLQAGEFGMAEETGQELNLMIRQGVEAGEGLGEAVGRRILAQKAPFASKSILGCSFSMGRPATVHVAIGTDVNHIHWAAHGASLGEGSYRDFLRFCERVALLEGGVYINLGSAVLMPEVFLKALSLARNLGKQLREITTVNMDFIQHYRPLTNVVRRPTALGGRGYALTGHHEIMLPLLAAAIKEEAWRRGIRASSPQAY
ncbi:MAG: hypothetical protein ACUVS3_07120 [Thermodesulfobacteriota bacterium]